VPTKPPRYKPKPINTKGVELPEGIQQLSESLAANAHDVWAKNRMAEGWRWGANRDDAHRRHPCLVPYSKLPESEKNYDRSTALETLKAIMALGYRIEKSR
jgi:hypothetical protein